VPGPDPETCERWGIILRDVLFALRHRLTPTVFIYAPNDMDWDSHWNNLRRQHNAMDMFAPAMCCFLDELEKGTTVDGVPLAKEVGIVFSSELGRFPIKNDLEGKDHFPEFPAVLMGPGIRFGQYGHTDANMASQPISVRSGKPHASSADIVPSIDDLGATILHWFGIDDPASLGYVGRRLDFLLA
jgi:hypothetical protein